MSPLPLTRRAGLRLATAVRQGLGPSGLAGLLLVASAVGLAWPVWHTSDLTAPNPAAQRSARPSSTTTASTPAAAAAPVPPADAAALALLGRLPPQAQLNDDLAQLMGWAGEQGLRIDRGRSEPQTDSGLPLQRVDLQLRLDGDYDTTRRWLVVVLNGLPHAAVRSLRFSRDSAEATTVQTQLVLRLHYQR